MKGMKQIEAGALNVGGYRRRSFHGRARRAQITEAEGSHVIMVSKPQVVAESILAAVAAAPRKEDLRAGR